MGKKQGRRIKREENRGREERGREEIGLGKRKQRHREKLEEGGRAK